VAQAVELLLCKHEALSSNLVPPNQQKDLKVEEGLLEKDKETRGKREERVEGSVDMIKAQYRNVTAKPINLYN
jgi:hypothetical protein